MNFSEKLNAGDRKLKQDSRRPIQTQSLSCKQDRKDYKKIICFTSFVKRISES